MRGCVCSQGARTVTNIERLFQSLAREYPNLDPAVFIKELGQLLESLVTNTLDLTSKPQPQLCAATLIVTDSTYVHRLPCSTVRQPSPPTATKPMSRLLPCGLHGIAVPTCNWCPVTVLHQPPVLQRV